MKKPTTVHLLSGGIDSVALLYDLVANECKVHCGRVNNIDKIEMCERLGCESVDGTGWFRDKFRNDKLPAIRRFIEGHRKTHPELSFAYKT